MENAVLARQSEIGRINVRAVEPHITALEVHHHSLALHFERHGYGRIGHYTRHPVCLGKRLICKAFPGLSLLTGMYGTIQPGVHQHRHADILLREAHLELGLAQVSGIDHLLADDGICIRGYLAEVEREIIAPFSAPLRDHLPEQGHILLGLLLVGLALIPYRPAHTVSHQGMDHGIVEHGGSAVGYSRAYVGSFLIAGEVCQCFLALPPQQSIIRPTGTPRAFRSRAPKK